MPKLKTPKTEEKSALLDETEFLADLTARARKAHLPRFERPKYADGTLLEPSLPPDLTILTDTQIGKLFSEFAAMAQWSQMRLAVYNVEQATKKRVEKMTRAKVRLEKSGTNQDKDAKVEIDPRTRAAGYEALLGEAIFTMTDAVLQGYLIGRDACSRELTRRGWSRENFGARGQ